MRPLPMLKFKVAYLQSAPVPLLERRSEDQVAQRSRGKALQTLRKRVLVRDQWVCQCEWCQAGGAPLPLTLSTAEVDHRRPLWAGGTNELSNLRALHKTCHARVTAAQVDERRVYPGVKTKPPVWGVSSQGGEKPG